VPDLQVQRTAVGHQQLVPHILDGRCRGGIEGKEQGAEALVLVLYQYQLLVRVRALAGGALQRELGEILCSHQFQRVVQEVVPELVDHLIFHGVDRAPLAGTGDGEVDGIQVHRNLPAIQRADAGAHHRCHQGHVVGHQYAKEQRIVVLAALAENLHQTLRVRVVLHVIKGLHGVS